MEVKNVTQAIEKIYQYSGLKSFTGVISIRVSEDQTNCKLSYIHGIGILSVIKDNNEKKLILDDIINNYCKGAIIINTTNKIVSDFIAATYPVYYYNNVPIGYNNTFQYHICIQN